jgi:hypothetical protein
MKAEKHSAKNSSIFTLEVFRDTTSLVLLSRTLGTVPLTLDLVPTKLAVLLAFFLCHGQLLLVGFI